MKFHLDPPKINHQLEITHASKLTLLGSCFSDEMLIHFRKAGFNVEGNPFGTLFHPLALTNLIDSALNQSSIHEEYYQRNDLFFSWLASGTFFETCKTEIASKEAEALLKLRKRLVASDFLLITFGTAWGYRLKTTNQLVANCHKAPANDFTKELSSLEALYSAWEHTLTQILEINPTIRIVFTLSPVRHVKDGLIENTRSKARLVELISRLEEKFSSTYYFPAYELVTDCLRDYRFYKSDLVHPSEAAVQYVWDFFKNAYFSTQTQDLAREVWKLHQENEHKSLYADSESERVFRANFEAKKKDFFSKNPSVSWY